MMKKVLSLLLAVLMIAALGLVMTACGDDKKDDKPTETQAATQAATSAPTQATETQASTQAASQAQTPTQAQDNGGSGIAGLSQEEAMNQAMQSYPGCYVNSIVESTDPYGNPAWVVYMIDGDYNDFTVYVTNGGVSGGGPSGDSQQDSTDAQQNNEATSAGGDTSGGSYAGMTASQAVDQAVGSLTGSCYATSWSQGYNNSGQACWVIYLTDSTTGKQYISFSGADGVESYPYTG